MPEKQIAGKPDTCLLKSFLYALQCSATGGDHCTRPSDKSAVAQTLGRTDDLEHAPLGLVLFVLGALITRRRMWSWWSLGIVGAFACE